MNEAEMTGVLARRRRRNRAEAAELVREFEEGGLTRAAFCAGRDLSVASLDEYRRRYGHGAARNAAHLVAVEVRPEIPTGSSSGALFVELRNGRWTEVGSGFDATTLERLLNVLEPA